MGKLFGKDAFGCVVAVILLALSSGSGAKAATPVFDAVDVEILNGADDVEVLGELYDVRFFGSCFDEGAGCERLDHPFTTEGQALSAAQALFDQVFVPLGAISGQNFLRPVRGCGNSFVGQLQDCSLLTLTSPYSGEAATDDPIDECGSSLTLRNLLAEFIAGGGVPLGISPCPVGGSETDSLGLTGSLGDYGMGVVADSFAIVRWDEAASTAVPLPAAGWLFLSGLVGLFAVGRRKGKSAAIS